MRDAELVAGILGGRMDFAVLWDEYWSRVYHCVHTTVRDAEQSKDLTNCVLERANERLARYDAKKGSLWTWLHLLAKTVVIASLRKRKLETVSLDRLVEKRQPTCEGPEEIHERAAVWRALDELPEPEHGVLVLHFHDGYSWDEVARLRGKPVSTIRDAALRGLAMLRRRL